MRGLVERRSVCGPLVAVLATLALAALLPAPARAEAGADPEERARARFAEGVARMRAADWPAAEAAFRAAYELYPTQSGLFNLGAAVLAQERSRDALALFDEYLERFATTAAPEQLEEVRRMRRRALDGLCEVTVEASPEDAQILVDGHRISREALAEGVLLEPGEHRFRARARGHVSREVTRRLEGGCRGEAVAISLRPRRSSRPGGPVVVTVPRTGPEERRGAIVAGWVTLALAGAAGVAAAITGGVALSLHGEFRQLSMRDDDWGPLQRDGRSLALTTDILIGVASAAAVACISLLVYGHLARGHAR